MPGHELADIDLANIPSKYFCRWCKKVLNDPVQTKCGHFYCSSCVDELRESSHSLRCKEDQTWLAMGELFRDKCVEREVLALPVHCPQKPCTWRGLLGDLQTHFRSCNFILIPCIFGCGEIVKRSDMGRHHQKCKIANSEARKEESIPQLTSLRDSDNYLSINGGCAFELIGCRVPKTLTADQLKEHSIKCAPFHMNLLLKYIQDLEQDLRSTLMQKIEGLITQANEQAEKILHLENVTRGLWGFDAEALLRRLINTENTNADLGVLIVELNTNIEELRNKVLQSERQQENYLKTITQLQARVDAQDQELRNLNRSNLDEQFNLLSMTTFDGILVWKITDVARKRNEALTNRNVSFCSPPFYTDRYGYKMCARIYLNGDGMGRGQYLSLFFVVMRGEYDALLRWPFRNKVTMMLLDQNQVEHVIDAFKPDPSSSSFQRPKKEMNIASGCPMFCPLNELENHAYVKDDTMFIKIIVDTSDSY